MPDLSADRPLPLPEEPFTEEDVDQLAQVMRDANTREAWSAATYPLMPMAHFAKVMLDHLARSGRLLPSSAEHREEWQLAGAWEDGSVWALSTADEAEALRYLQETPEGTVKVLRRSWSAGSWIEVPDPWVEVDGSQP